MLNKHDKYLLDTINRLGDTGYLDENPRASYKDGNEANALSVRGGVYEVYDLEKGEFPITWTRPIPFGSSINEMLVIYQDQYNTNDGFKSRNVNWWGDWCNENGNIGRAYPYNLESHRANEMRKEVVLVKHKKVNPSEYEVKEIGLVNPIQESLDNKVYSSHYREYGEYIIIDEFSNNDDNNRKYVKVQFLESGYITSLRKDSLKRGQHPIDNFKRTLLNIGYLGNYKSVNGFSETQLKKLKSIWDNMIKRCYTDEKPSYKNNYVHSDWHSFENFLNDIKYIPQYFLAKESNFEGYHLDKDYYNSNCYSKDTCVFLSHTENIKYRKNQHNPIKLISDINELVFINKSELSKFLGVSRNTVSRGVKNKKLLVNGIVYKVEELENVEGYSYRLELSRNQIVSLISNLRNDPFGRRHIVSFYNWANMNKKELVECAYETMWSVSVNNGKKYLDLTLIQRSSDLLVAGTGINQMEYVAMQIAIANDLGYEVGLFEFYRKNVHVYDRHLEQLEETIKRLELMQSDEAERTTVLKLNRPVGTSFFDIEVNDFELVNYRPIKPQLKFELGI